MDNVRAPIHLEQINLRRLVSKLQAHMLQFGYQIADTPMIERADLFLTKAGDQVAERLFTFERHGHNLALRPEFTAAAAHRYAQQYPTQQAIVRWQFSGAIFEDDPQKTDDHYQQFSIGAELIGMAGPAADAEIIAMAAQSLAPLGLEQWQLVIGHVGLTRRLLERFSLDARTQRFVLNRLTLLHDPDGVEVVRQQLDTYLPSEQAHDLATNGDITDETNTQQMLDILLDASKRGETMGGRTRHDIARRLLAKRKQASQRDQVDAALDFLQGWINISAPPEDAMKAMEPFIGADPIAWSMFAELKSALEYLTHYGIPENRIRIQPDLARTWDYYTGLVFELRVEDRQIAGGGRYDELTRLIGGTRDVPAVGFAYYVDELFTVLSPEESKSAPVITLVSANNTHALAIQWASVLRKHDFPVAVVNRLPSDADTLLHINGDGSVRFGQHLYAPEQIDFLVMELQQWTQH